MAMYGYGYSGGFGRLPYLLGANMKGHLLSVRESFPSTILALVDEASSA
jgi:hypothetical protein